jgi:uncharacterized protein YbjT (DUF2867 family)
MIPQNILLLGGSGFVGSHVADHLTELGLSVRVPTRHRNRAKQLILLPTVDVVEADINDQSVLTSLCKGMDAVINLVGVLHSASGDPYGRDFRAAHVELPKKIIVACRANGISRLLHMSALPAAADAPSEYLRSKATGEELVLSAKNEFGVTVFRPSVVFGEEDRFLNLFASLQKWLPVVFLARPDAKLQPVYVVDVAKVIVEALGRHDSHGKSYDLAGPEVHTLREIVASAGAWAGHARPIFALSDGLGNLQATVMQHLPGKLLTTDNLRSLKVDSVSDAPFPFGIRPTAMSAVAPTYLSGALPRVRYRSLRAQAGR